MIGNPDKTNAKTWRLFLFSALLLGVFLRLSFPNDIEYKADEKYMFDAVQSIGVTQPWPMVGVSAMGTEMRHPALGLWIFVVLSRLTHASTPPGLAADVQYLNILGLLVLAFFSLCLIPEPGRPFWCWATALAAVNPIAVLFQRKIWIPCLLPFFCVLFWMAWHYRKKRPGAFFWGLLGVCLGQIHLSGFFLAAGVFLWTVLRDRQARWGSWVTGSLLGAIPLIPWVQYNMAVHSGNGFNWKNLFWMLVPKFWMEWLTDSFGLGLSHSFSKDHYLEFLAYPLVGGKGTYLVGLLHLAIIVTGVLILISATKSGFFSNWIKDSSETGLAVNSVLIAAGVLMTLSCIIIRRHYLLMTFPLEWVWLARMGLRDEQRGPGRLRVIWIAQLLISVLFLVYIHINHGDPMGDYGVAYQFQ